MRATQAVRVLIPIIKGPARETLRTPALVKPPTLGTQLPEAIVAASQALENAETPDQLSLRTDLSEDEKAGLLAKYKKNQAAIHSLPWRALRNANAHPLDVLAVRRAQEADDFPPNLRIERRVPAKYLTWKVCGLRLATTQMLDILRVYEGCSGVAMTIVDRH